MGYTPRDLNEKVFCKGCDFYFRNFWTSRETCRIDVEETNHFGIKKTGFIEADPAKKNMNNDCKDHREWKTTSYYGE